MRGARQMKPVLWIGSSLKDLKKMPEAVQSEVGHSFEGDPKG